MSEKGGRLIYVDNLRLFLTVLVIVHHVSVAYGGAGGWPLKEAPSEIISPILLTLFNGINQSFFMSLFFLLSGYFVPASFDKKGAKKFLADRLIRLGVPLLVYATFLRAALDYMLMNFVQGKPVSFLDVFANPSWVVGPLWFLEELLIFSAAYALYRVLIHSHFNPLPFPSDRIIAAAVLSLALLTFAVRLFYPVGVEFHVFQLAHSVSYMFFFWVGILAYRGRWFDNLPDEQARRCKKTAASAVAAFPLILLLGIFTGGLDVTPFFGGFTWQSALYSLWEPIAAVSISISLLDVFKKRFNSQGSLSRWAAPSFYAAYIIHQPLIVAVMIPLLGVATPTYFKFIFVSIIGVPLCFILSDLLRRIPGARRVLG